MIFEKQLYMLIPFYIFKFEKDTARLLKEQEEGRLSANSISVIIGVTHSVFSKLTSKQTVLNEKVGGYMGGKVLDPPWVIAYNKGKEEGKEEAIADMLRRGKTVSEIVEFCNFPEDFVRKIEESLKITTV